MPKVFVSYAHSSPLHKRLVSDLVEKLRASGLTVFLDADVITPQGPEEGWPRWMKRRIEEANWVLMLFDEVYRRRFDGEEAFGMGQGATWEGAIITHHFNRSSTLNRKFIPLLVDGDSSNLIPDEFFGFNRYSIPSQTEKLAFVLNDPPNFQSSTAHTKATSSDLSKDLASARVAKLIEEGKVPFLEVISKFVSHEHDRVNFTISVRNLSDAVAISPSLQLDADATQHKIPSLPKNEGRVLPLHWANTFGSNLNLKVRLYYSILENQRFVDEGLLSISFYPDGHLVPFPKM